MQHLDARGDAKLLGGKMGAAADAGRAVGERTGLGLGGGDELGHALRPGSRIDDQHHRLARERRHGHEFALWVVGHRGIQRRIDRVARRMHEKRVAVGARARDRHRGERTAGARAVLDHHRLLPELGELRRERARDDVGHAAGREGNDHAHRLVRERVRRGDEERRQEKHELHAAKLP